VNSKESRRYKAQQKKNN